MSLQELIYGQIHGKYIYIMISAINVWATHTVRINKLRSIKVNYGYF